MPNLANWKFATADGSILAREGLLYGFVLTAGTETANCVFRDGTTATSTIIIPLISAATGGSVPVIHDSHPHRLKNGLYVDLTGTAASVAVLIG